MRIHHKRYFTYALIFLCLFLVAFLRSLEYREYDSEKSSEENLEEPEEEPAHHTFIHSVYYFKESRSLGKNAIAIVTAMDKYSASSILEYKLKIIGTNATDSITTDATLSTEHNLNDLCTYLMILAQTNTLDNLETLEIESGDTRVAIPFRLPRDSAPKPVIFCVSPQFVAEQWQTFIAQMHISRRYGAHLQIYVVSMVDTYFALLREYEKMGYLTIEPWLTMKFENPYGPYLEPNSNVEVRNQAAAHTDCILQYKEVASFVGAIDLDDILIPKQTNSYYEEFEMLYEGSNLISSLYFVKKDYEASKLKLFEDQTVSSIIKSSKVLPSHDLGKSFSRPDRVNSTWSHFPKNAPWVPTYLANGSHFYRTYKKIQDNGMMHLKYLNTVPKDELVLGDIPQNFFDNSTIWIKEEHLKEIDRDLRRVSKNYNIKTLSKYLPKENFYMPIILKCYTESFYYLRDSGTFDNTKVCVNAYYCDLPQKKSIKCIHSDGAYHSGPKMSPITFHWSSAHHFSRDIGCYQ